uniref:Uncharacterized protein n=1 Tax=Alexandrium monilatum TaxID=311494 RepID=A0A7S4PX35_9DINO|mmetsp:Transcript_90063/g.285173  ORF Transcript_90063/g.285173 Transcript_90063/m.285173 type:complete len:154 (+) Transcript_90063:110-571(+)
MDAQELKHTANRPRSTTWSEFSQQCRQETNHLRLTAKDLHAWTHSRKDSAACALCAWEAVVSRTNLVALRTLVCALHAAKHLNTGAGAWRVESSIPWHACRWTGAKCHARALRTNARQEHKQHWIRATPSSDAGPQPRRRAAPQGTLGSPGRQ